MTSTGSNSWTVAPAPVDSADAAALLRDFYIDVSDRYYEFHRGRPSTPAEIDEGLAGFSNDDLAPPTGVFMIGRYGGEPAGCVALRVRDTRTVELTRMFVRPALRGTGGGSRLLAAAHDAARDLGAERIVLDTRLDLVEARALYGRHGYTEIRAYNDNPYAEIWYAKELGRSRADA